MSPLFDLSRRDRFHEVGGCSGDISAHCLYNQATIPSGVKLALAFTAHGYVVPASVILE